MRCKRCHAVIAEGRKSCPNCGTLIRKKRGNITLSAQSGVQVNRIADGISDGIYNLKMAIRRDSRILILLVAVPLVLIGSILLISCGASSCSCSCSCGGNHEKTPRFEAKLNSYKPSAQFAVGETLYYISEGSIMSRNTDESYKHIYDCNSASDLQCDGEYIYFREDNRVRRIEIGKTAVSGTDIAETVLDYSGDENYSLGYFIAEGKLYYTLKENGSHLTTLYSDRTLLCGEYADFGYMNGKIYYTVSDSDTTRALHSVNTDGTEDKLVASGISGYQVGGGYIYTIRASADKKLLSRINADGTVAMDWDIRALTGNDISSFAANDTWLCFVNKSEEGSVVYRIEHDSVDINSIFAYSKQIELTGVSGDWYAFEYTETKEDQTIIYSYSIRNSKNGKSAM